MSASSTFHHQPAHNSHKYWVCIMADWATFIFWVIAYLTSCPFQLGGILLPCHDWNTCTDWWSDFCPKFCHRSSKGMGKTNETIIWLILISVCDWAKYQLLTSGTDWTWSDNAFFRSGMGMVQTIRYWVGIICHKSVHNSKLFGGFWNVLYQTWSIRDIFIDQEWDLQETEFGSSATILWLILSYLSIFSHLFVA